MKWIKRLLAVPIFLLCMATIALADPKVGDPMPPIQNPTPLTEQPGSCGDVAGLLTVYRFADDPNKVVVTIVMEDKKVAEIVTYDDESEYTAYIDDTDSGKISRIIVDDKDTGDVCADLYPAN